MKRLGLFFVIVGVFGGRVFAQQATLSIVPIGGNQVAGGTVVTLEVFITVDLDTCAGAVSSTNPNGIRFEGGQVDLPCSLPPLAGATGTISVLPGAAGATTNPDGVGGPGPSSGGVPYIFGVTGLGPYQSSSCVIAMTPGIGSGPENVDVGQTRYLGTYFYRVSDCATGDFNAIFEGLTDPPVQTNSTRFRDDCPAQAGNGPLVDMSASTPVLTVPVGRCCAASSCVGEMNEFCCLNGNPGRTWTAGSTCADGCPCSTPSECNDNNACTTDTCDGGFCQNTPNNDSCNDGLFCTANDACVDGACVGSGDACPGQLCSNDLAACVQCLVNADCPPDGIECTDDLCSPQGDCVYPNDDTNSCSDGLFCTRTDSCSGGICVGSPRACPAGQVCCEDADACRQCCDFTNCDDQNVCTTDACAEPAGTCTHDPASGPCDDGLFCTFLDTCNGGSCVPGTSSPCQAGEQCIEDTDECVECLNPGECDDTNQCTQDDCVDGVCVHTPEGAGTVCGSPKSTPCDNRDTCDGQGVCQPNPKPDGTLCEDGTFCNGVEECSNGMCKPGTPPQCPVGEVCDPVADECRPAPQCDDHTDCDDSNPCTNNVCVSGQCTFPPNSATCDDGDGCTINDQCSNGSCVGGGPRVCEDGNACTANTCVSGSCQFPPLAAGIACGSSADSDCDNPDTCNGAGQCLTNNELNGTACTTDGNECTNDVCTGGVCTHAALPVGTACGSAASSDCDDADTCNGSGVCQSNNRPGGTVCTTDNNDCTNDVCAAGACTHPPRSAGSACGSGSVTDCDGADTCNGSGVCQTNTRPDGSACTTDNIECTNDVCAAGVCTHPALPAGSACGSTANTDCDNPNTCSAGGVCQPNNEPDDTACTTDNNACTQDVCRAGVCAHPPVSAGTACGDPTETACNHADTCNGAGVCSPNLETNGSSCSDGLFCNGGETCQSGNCLPGTAPNCDDRNPCTSDSCNEGTDQCDNTAIPDCTAAGQRLSTTQKGSLLIYSKVEIRWDLVPEGMLGGTVAGGAVPGPQFAVSQDTFLDISNDFTEDVNVQLYFINGDAPLEAECDPGCVLAFGRCVEECVIERAHPGWNWADCQFRLTANQPTYWSALTGLPAGCQPFTVLDPGYPPGRPDPDGSASRVLRGYVLAWAVDRDGREIRWNHLSGDAEVVNYSLSTAWEYNAYVAQAVSANHGEPSDGTPGQLLLDGREYQNAFDRLVFDFYATDAETFWLDGILPVRIDTDVTLHAVSADLRQETTGPVTTKAVYDVWNQDERRFSEMERCVTCWDQSLASNYGSPNYFMRDALHTDKGKARVNGQASQRCGLSVDAALLGLTVKHLAFGLEPTRDRRIGFARSAITMTGTGEQDAVIRYDLPSIPDELFFGLPFEEAKDTPHSELPKGKERK